MSIRERLHKLHYGQAVLVALSVCFFFPVIVPLQTFLGNGDMFQYGAWDVLAEAVPVAVALSIVVFVLLVASELVLGRLLHVIIAAVLLCEYLEIGLFSIGLPPLDGGWVGLDNPFRKIIDSFLIGTVFVFVVGLFKWTKEISHWICLSVIVMSAASLFDTHSPIGVTTESVFSSGRCQHSDVVQSVRFSPKRNVILLILDSTPAVIASAALREKPELLKHFPGFVAYDKNIAMAENTAHGLPGLMTGQFFTHGTSTFDWKESVFGDDSLLKPYVMADDSVYYLGGLAAGYTNRRLGDSSKSEVNLKKTGSVFLRNSNGIPYVSLLDVVKFRLAPYVCKKRTASRAYANAMRGIAKKDYGSEDFLYPHLASVPLGDEPKSTLCVLHTAGTHGPITRDRDGKPLPTPTQDVKAHYEYGIYLMSKVGEFMDYLRQKGIYDNSLIIVAADHGLIVLRNGGLEADGSDGHGAESSILWVKPVGQGINTKMRSSSIPTSNCRIAELVRQSESRDLKQDEIDEILRVKGERRFLAKHGVKWWSFGKRLFFYEWRYDEDGKLVGYENKGIFKMN